MKNLFDKNDYQEIVARIDLLSPASQRLWGKMDVAQMMAHCSAAFEVALGERKRSRAFLGYLFGKMAKKSYIYSTNYSKNGPTDPTFKIVDARNFEVEKARLIKHIDKFYRGGPDVVTKDQHPFFGRLTPMEWALLKYNHLNHHLSQFGV